ncbi:hypothetical protein DFJ73DRAFT_52319 [Zopfochytrium polystomum]|nr:hypothetical protein DFJ73DRAFT_52319 [Zopfochytrium polystomum]
MSASRSSSISSDVRRAKSTLPPLTAPPDSSLLSDVITAVAQSLRSRPWLAASAPVVVHVVLRMSGFPDGAVGPMLRLVSGFVQASPPSSSGSTTDSSPHPKPSAIPTRGSAKSNPTKKRSNPNTGSKPKSQPKPTLPSRQQASPPQPPPSSQLKPVKGRPSRSTQKPSFPPPPPPPPPPTPPSIRPSSGSANSWLWSWIFGSAGRRESLSALKPLDAVTVAVETEMKRKGGQTFNSVLFKVFVIVTATAVVVIWRTRQLKKAAADGYPLYVGRPPGFRARSTLPPLLWTDLKPRPTEPAEAKIGALPAAPPTSVPPSVVQAMTKDAPDSATPRGRHRDSKFDPVFLTDKLALAMVEGKTGQVESLLREPMPALASPNDVSPRSIGFSPTPPMSTESSPKQEKLPWDVSTEKKLVSRKSRDGMRLFHSAVTSTPTSDRSSVVLEVNPPIAKRQTSLAKIEAESTLKATLRHEHPMQGRSSNSDTPPMNPPSVGDLSANIRLPQHGHAPPVRPHVALPVVPSEQKPPPAEKVFRLGSSTASKRSLPMQSMALTLIDSNVTFHRQLTQLWLNDNALTFLPDELFLNCPNLVFLDVSNNRLAPHIPLSISNCSNLRELYASGNSLTEVEPRHISESPRANSSRPSLTGLRALTRLEVLDLRKNRISYLPHDLFTTLRQLRALFLSDNKLRALPSSLGLLAWRNPGATSSDLLLAKKAAVPDPSSNPDSDPHAFAAVGGVLTWLDLEKCGPSLDAQLCKYLIDPLVAANRLVSTRVLEHFAERQRAGGGWMSAAFSASTLRRRGSRSVAAGGAPSAIDVIYLGQAPPAESMEVEAGNVWDGYEVEDDEKRQSILMDPSKYAQMLELAGLDSPVESSPPRRLLMGPSQLESPSRLKKRKSNPESRSPQVSENPNGYFTLRRNSNESIASVTAPTSPRFPEEHSQWSHSAPSPPASVLSNGSQNSAVPLSQLHPGFGHLQRLLSHLRDQLDLDPRTVSDLRHRRSESLMALRKSSSMTESGHAGSIGDDPDAPGLTEGEREKIRKRQSPARRANIAAEFLSTERTYVKELQALDDIYVTPLESGGSARDILTKNDTELLFSNVKLLLSFHKQYVPKPFHFTLLTLGFGSCY